MGKKICRMVGLILTLAVVLSVFSACGSERKIIDSSDLTSETEIIGTENQVLIFKSLSTMNTWTSTMRISMKHLTVA